MRTLIRSKGQLVRRAKTPLRIATPDGGGQAVHPDVVHISGGFSGFTYWMACTPYPFGDDEAENPIVRVSNDGVSWEEFPGAPDPIVPAPANRAWHHADTDLVLFDGTLYLFYISTNRHTAETVFSLSMSRDGRNWSDPESIYRDKWGVSPALIANPANGWRLWYVWCDTFENQQDSILYVKSGTSPTTLGRPTQCELRIPGFVIWHLDVISVSDGFEALVTAFPFGTDPSRSKLFHATSVDGIVFNLSTPSPIIVPSVFGWDNRMIYRSSFLKGANNTYRIWYTGASWGMRCGIGLVEGPLEALTSPLATTSSNISIGRRLFENAVGLSKYLVARWVSPRALRVLVSLRNRLR